MLRYFGRVGLNIFDLSYPLGPFDQKSVDRNCVFSVDQNFHNQLTKNLDGFQLIETFNNEFDQTPKI